MHYSEFNTRHHFDLPNELAQTWFLSVYKPSQFLAFLLPDVLCLALRPKSVVPLPATSPRRVYGIMTGAISPFSRCGVELVKNAVSGVRSFGN